MVDYNTIKDIEKRIELAQKREYKVVKSNDLIQKGKFHLNASEQKLVCYVISLVKPTDEIFSRYTIKAKDFAELCGIPLKNVYRDFKRLIDELDIKVFWVKDNEITYKFRWFSEAEYNDKKGTITVMLHSRIKSYLLQLQSNFTQYELWNILALKSKWSIRLYELFRSYNYKNRISFQIDELRELIGAETYVDFYDLRRRIIDKAKAEINKYTDLNISYEIEKGGRGGKTKEITFMIEKKESCDGYLAYRRTVKEIEKRNGGSHKGQLYFNIDGSISEEG